MAVKTTLNEKNLAALGADRLATLVMEVVKGNAALKRQARAALLESAGGDVLVAEVRKRISTLRRSKSRVGWNKRPLFVKDLDQQRRMIVEKITPADPSTGFELMWQFMGLAESAHNRADDSNGDIGDVFRQGCSDLGVIAVAAKPAPAALADQVFHAVFEQNDYAEYDGLIDALASVLGEVGLSRLKSLALDAQQKLASDKPKPNSGHKIGWGASGPIYEGEFRHRAQTNTLKYLLQEIADAQGDVDAFIAGYDDEARTIPQVAAAIALRLVGARRAEEALIVLDKAERPSGRHFGMLDAADAEWTDARIIALEALNRHDDAQVQRWTYFEQTLSSDHIRNYLKRLDDFDDVDAEERALEYVATHEDIHKALAFLTHWPDLRRAAHLVMREQDKWDGNRWYDLPDIAQALAGSYPVAASVLLRTLILDTMNGAKSKRYKHAVRHLMECESLDHTIEANETILSHDDFIAALRRDHGRKSGFWSLVPSSG